MMLVVLIFVVVVLLFLRVRFAGLYQAVVRNVSELESLMMVNKSYCATIAGNVGARSRKDIVARAKVLNIKVTNAGARLTTVDHE